MSGTIIDTVNENKENPEKIRSNEDILSIIFEADSTVLETENCGDKKNNPSLSIKTLKANSLISSVPNKSNEDLNEKMTNCIFCIKDIEAAALYNVVWCKRSSKKVTMYISFIF